MSEPLSIALAVSAAGCFGLSTVTAKRGLAHVDAQTGSLLSIATVTVLYGVASPLWAEADQWFTFGFWIFAVNGLFNPMLSIYLSYEATARTSPTVAATFSATSPVFATMTAVALLGEELSTLILAGTLGIVLGVGLLSWRPDAAMGLVRVALLFATGAAVIRGFNHTLAKFGLTLLPNVFMAIFVSYVVSLAGQLVMYRMRGAKPMRSIPRRGLVYFVCTGSIIAVAMACLYAALRLGNVVVVAPIVASYPLFALAAAFAIGEERVTRQLLGGVALVVAGVVLISYTTAA